MNAYTDVARSNVGAGRRVTVVGAGFSGLTSAYALARAGFSVTVLEASARAGGLLQTIRTQHGLVETAANALLNSPAVETMFKEIGLECIGTKPEAKKRFIFRAGRARRWPLGFFATFKVAVFLLRYIMFRSGVSPRPQETTRAWATRVLGEEASSYLVEAGLQGVYAGDPSKMSASLILGRMFARPLITTTGASTPAKKSTRLRGSVSAPEGIGQLIDALQTHLEKQGVEFKFNEPAMLDLKPDHPHVIAVAGHGCGAVIQKLLPRKAAITQTIEFAPVVTATAFFAETDRKSRGFGVLFPPRENGKVLGVLKNNFIFPNRVFQAADQSASRSSVFSETWILGGALATDTILDKNEDEIRERILLERKACFGRDDQMIAIQITRWSKGIPQYTLDLEKVISELQGVDQNVILMGNYLGDIGLAKILDRALRLPAQIHASGEWA